MRETVLLFHFSDKDRRNRLVRALLPMRMKIKEISKEDYGKPVGYLAGNVDILPGQPHAAEEELSDELMVMAGLSGHRVDQVLRAMRKSGVLVAHKAVLTPSNQTWNVYQLFEEIHLEHERMAGK